MEGGGHCRDSCGRGPGDCGVGLEVGVLEVASEPSSVGRRVAIGIFGATVGQLLVASVATELPQFAGKGFGARLVAYPVLMLLVPAVWALRRRRRGGTEPVPWAGFGLIMAPFLIDVTGNTLPVRLARLVG